MSSYRGWHAELYDLFYADKAYEQEAGFVDVCLREFSIGKTERLLEVACGTGRHALAFEQLGYRVTATDYSDDMLAVARRRGERSQSRIEFLPADMRELSVTGAAFDAVVCLFDSIGYVLTNDAVLASLRGMHRHLRDDGLLVFEFWHAAAMLRGYDPLRVRRWQTPAGEVLRISETELCAAEQTCRVKYSIYKLRRDGTYRSLVETQRNRYFSLQEMASFLGQSGFAPLKWFAGFANDETIDDGAWHVVAVARKARAG